VNLIDDRIAVPERVGIGFMTGTRGSPVIAAERRIDLLHARWPFKVIIAA
jgi:hypothetical protein